MQGAKVLTYVCTKESFTSVQLYVLRIRLADPLDPRSFSNVRYIHTRRTPVYLQEASGVVAIIILPSRLNVFLAYGSRLVQILSS